MRFESQYIPTKQLLREYYACAVFPHRILPAAGTLLLAVAAVIAFFMIPSENSAFVFLPILSGVFALAGLTVIFSPNIAAASSLPKGEIPESTVAFGDAIFVREFGYEINYPYDDITSIIEIPSSFVITIGTQSKVIIPKNSFTIGSEADFRSFLNTISAKI